VIRQANHAYHSWCQACFCQESREATFTTFECFAPFRSLVKDALSPGNPCIFLLMALVPAMLLLYSLCHPPGKPCISLLVPRMFLSGDREVAFTTFKTVAPFRSFDFCQVIREVAFTTFKTVTPFRSLI
jgi:hypothetical protein